MEFWPVTHEWLVDQGGYNIPLFGDGRPGFAVKKIVAGREWVFAFYKKAIDEWSHCGVVSEWAIVANSNEHLWLPTSRDAEHRFYIPKQIVLAVWAALTGPIECDMRKIVESMGFDPTNHHNAAKCPYCQTA